MSTNWRKSVSPWGGFHDLGPPQIPRQPPSIGMTDRVTGDVWWLKFDGANITLNSQQPVGPQRAYGPYDGPCIAAFGLKLAVSNGRVIFEQSPSDGSAPPFAVQNFQNLAQIFAQTIGNDPNLFDHLTFEPQLTQPPNPTGPVTPFPPYIP